MKSFTFRLDCAGKTEPVKKHWQFCVGSGHAALAQRVDYVEQLKLVHDELGIERVRFHGILNDDMNVCVRLSDHLPLKTRNKTKIYDFYQVGRVYDNLLSAGVKPFVEIGFMPKALASGKKTVFYYKGNVTLPKNMEAWKDFIRAFARFLIRRYGREEVRTWYFEVWNEPDLACFFKGSMRDYFRLYAETVRALKEVDAQLLVGGPATTRGRHLTAFLDFCQKESVPVDFVSTHQYPTDALGHSINRERLRQISKMDATGDKTSTRALLQPVFDNVNDFNRSLKGYMTREAKRAREAVGDLPLFYTEWSISSNCTAAIHDTTAAAAFFVKTVLDNQGVVDGSSYWTFSDIFEELFFFTDPFCGGFGLLTVDGIKKPTFWACKMLASLPDARYRLPVTDDDVELAAFRGEDGSLYLLLYAQNFEPSGEKYRAHIELQNAGAFRTWTVNRVDAQNGNPVALWEAMGKPAALSKAELADIRTRSEPKTESGTIDEGKLSKGIDIQLCDNDVVMLVLKP